MRAATKVSFAALCTVPFVMVLSNSMIIPELPSMQRAMDLTLLQAGLIITAFSIPAGLFIPLGGYLSDQIGRKSVIIPALLIFGAGGLIAGLAPLFFSDPYNVILAGRVIQGVGAAGTYQVAMSLTGDIFQSQERSEALGLLEASNGVGKVISPLLGAAAGLLIWYAPFYLYPVLSWLAAVAVWIKVEEPSSQGQQRLKGKEYIDSLKDIAKQKGVSLGMTFVAGFTALFVLFGLLSYYSDILESAFDVTGFSKGLVIAIPVTVMTVTSFLSGTLAQKALAKLVKPVCFSGLLLIGAGVVMMLFVDGFLLTTTAISISGLGTGMLLPAINTLITSAAEWQERGLITAFYGAVRFFGTALGPPAFGLINDVGRGPVFWGTAILAAVSAVLLVKWVQEKALLPDNLSDDAPEEPSEKTTPQGFPVFDVSLSRELSQAGASSLKESISPHKQQEREAVKEWEERANEAKKELEAEQELHDR